VINLDRRKDRWDEFSSQETMKQFKKLERFSAVDGSKLDPFTDKRIGIHTRLNIVRNYRRSHYEINTLGAIGASLSHIGIWKRFLESDAEYAVVFEDDTVVREEDLTRVDTLIRDLPQGWDLWLLGTHKWMYQGVPLTDDPKGWSKTLQFTGAHAYVISRRGAQILLDEPFPIETHIEFYITACVKLKGLKIVRHPSLRIGYNAEYTKENDSDTFESRFSCPVCYVPDNYMDTLYILSKNGWPVRTLQVGTVLLGGYIAWRLYKQAK
jgi:hypothetical protein